MDLKNLKRILRNNRITGKLYRKLWSSVVSSQISYDIPEVQKITARFEEGEDQPLRLNILVPSIDKMHVFGGISTALKFFEQLGTSLEKDMRIIVTDSMVDINTSVKLEGYEVVPCMKNSTAKKQIVPYADRYEKTISVHKNDVFMATGWWTAYTIADVIREQMTRYEMDSNPLIYFIQDYEPGFYPWSSRYLMADSTYRLDIPTIAIFNSNLLKDFFEKNDYTFYREFSFDPVLNDNLKEILVEKKDSVARKNQIILYGRPSVSRNAFELILASLKKWALMMDAKEQWDVLALGETFDAIELGNGKKIVSKGKMSLEEYAEVMLETKIGISLMVSPHPSYPPLEMSTFGVKTITNTYGNKDLAGFNQNIVSLNNCSETTLANKLYELCKDQTIQYQVDMNEGYVGTNNVFDDIIAEVREELLK